MRAASISLNRSLRAASATPPSPKTLILRIVERLFGCNARRITDDGRECKEMTRAGLDTGCPLGQPFRAYTVLADLPSALGVANLFCPLRVHPRRRVMQGE